MHVYSQDADDLDVEALIRKVIKQHTRAILSVFQYHLRRDQQIGGFVSDDETIFVDNGESSLALDKCSSNVSLLTGHRHHSRIARPTLR